VTAGHGAEAWEELHPDQPSSTYDLNYKKNEFRKILFTGCKCYCSSLVLAAGGLLLQFVRGQVTVRLAY
jgi:hypothetical protein